MATTHDDQAWADYRAEGATSSLQATLNNLGSEWEAPDDDQLVTCCGDALELDGEKCPSCGAPNPIRALGII